MSENCKCTRCEENERKLDIVGKRIYWMESVLEQLTDGLSFHYFKACRDYEAVSNTGLSHEHKNMLEELKRMSLRNIGFNKK